MPVSIKKIAASMTLMIIMMTVIFNSNTRADVSKSSTNNWIKKTNYNVPTKGTIVIGDDMDYPPYSFLDNNGRPTGFNIELAQALSEVMDFNVEFKLGNWNEIKNELKAGKIDAISGMFYSAEREKDYSFTTKHTVTNGDIFTRKGTSVNNIRDLQGKTVVVQADDIINEYLKKQNLNIKFIEVSTVAEALRLVSSQKYDFAAVLKVPGHYLINNLKLTNLKSNGLHITPNDYCMAVQKDNEDLLLALNGGLQILKSNGRYQEIYDKWLGVYEKRSLWQVVKEYSLLIVSILVAILILFAWSITLRRSVNAKTKELTAANEKLQESHEELLASNEELEDYISQLATVEEELREERNLLKTTLLSVGDGVIATDGNSFITMMNHRAERLTGWSKDEARTKKLEEVYQIHYEDSEVHCENPVKKALETRFSVSSGDNTKLITKSGKEISISDSVAPIKDRDGKIKGAVLVFRDVTEERKNQKRIQYLSYHDQLTGLYNRRYFEEHLNCIDIKENLPITALMADVNGLKLINDSFGHSTGDELLVKVARAIEKGTRAGDIISRTGGDEFVILLPKTDSSEAEEVVKHIYETSSKEKVASIDLSISFGWQTKYYEEENIIDVLKKAEDYMYKRKLFEGPSMRGKTIGAIINTLNEKNKREEEHSHRVSLYCESMGKALELSEGEIQVLKTVGLLHDIGKIAINEGILNKPGELLQNEWEEIKKHPEIGYRILSTVNDMSEMADYVLAHHERWDGLGYPKGIRGEEISLQSRIISIADAYDAMISERSYRAALPEEAAIAELKKNAGIQFDPVLVKVFIKKVLNNQ